MAQCVVTSMSTDLFKAAKVAVVTNSFSAKAALYEHLFQYENAVSVEKSYAVMEGKDVLVLAVSNSYGIPSDSIRDALRSVLPAPFV